jgi:hypothetical protein
MVENSRSAEWDLRRAAEHLAVLNPQMELNVGFKSELMAWEWTHYRRRSVNFFDNSAADDGQLQRRHDNTSTVH